MDTVPNETTEETAEEAKARLKDEYPEWNIICSNRGRWWATRGPLLSEKFDRPGDVSADTPEGLAEAIQAVARDES